MRRAEYNRINAENYARKWALARNPAYYNFENYNLGGDCTNFVSQCLAAGGAVMNTDGGWYYKNLNSRGPAWTGAEAFYNFIVTNNGAGPYGHIVDLNKAMVGDIVQLSFDGSFFSHSLLITGFDPGPDPAQSVLVSAHTFDCLDRPLNTYFYKKLRVIHISGVGF